jgi:hypothetical protein
MSAGTSGKQRRQSLKSLFEVYSSPQPKNLIGAPADTLGQKQLVVSPQTFLTATVICMGQNRINIRQWLERGNRRSVKACRQDKGSIPQKLSRGRCEFAEISWDDFFSILTKIAGHFCIRQNH